MLVTTAGFLPQHHAHLQQTLQIVTVPEAVGHARVAEMNRRVAGNLVKIIAALDRDKRLADDGGRLRRQLARTRRPVSFQNPIR